MNRIGNHDNLRGFITVDSLTNTGTLCGYFLVASPNMDDDYFSRSVVLICAHDNEGSFGVVINKKDGICTSDDIYKKFPDTNNKTKANFQIYAGGPVDNDSLLVIAIPNDSIKDFEKNPKFIIYNNAELYLRDYLEGLLDDTFFLARGYCSWLPGQLEAELADNSWILHSPSLGLITDSKSERKWNDIMKSLKLKNKSGFVNYSGFA